MALKLEFNHAKIDATFPEAYAKIGRFVGDKKSTRYDVEVFSTEAARRAHKQAVENKFFSVPTPEGDILPALYAHLKTQPGFEDAEDC